MTLRNGAVEVQRGRFGHFRYSKCPRKTHMMQVVGHNGHIGRFIFKLRKNSRYYNKQISITAVRVRNVENTCPSAQCVHLIDFYAFFGGTFGSVCARDVPAYRPLHRTSRAQPSPGGLGWMTGQSGDPPSPAWVRQDDVSLAGPGRAAGAEKLLPVAILAIHRRCARWLL